MPEGDASWRAARRLHDALAGRTLTRAELRVPAHATADLTGREVLEVVSRGKHQLVRIAGGFTVHTHLRMDGRWQVVPSGGHLPGPDFERRVILANPEVTAVGLKLGEVDLVRTEDESSLVGHLGPDLLGPDWDADEAQRRIAADPERSIGEALLDQRNLAGLGTLWRSELLFLQGIHPRTPVAQVTNLRRLVARAHQVLMANRGARRSTTGSTRRGQEYYVFERPRQPCRRCRTPIAVEEFGPVGRQRLSYWCPHCQPARTGA